MTSFLSFWPTRALIRLVILKKNGYKMLLDGGESKNVGDIATKDSSRVPSRTPEQNLGRLVQNSPTLTRREGPNTGFSSRDLEGRAMQAMHKFTNNIAGPSRPSWQRRPQEPQEESGPTQGQRSRMCTFFHCSPSARLLLGFSRMFLRVQKFAATIHMKLWMCILKQVRLLAHYENCMHKAK